MSWTNWYCRPNYQDGLEQAWAEYMLEQRIEEEECIKQKTIECKRMSKEQSELIPPDYDENKMFENKLVGYIGVIDDEPKVKDSTPKQEAKFRGRPQNKKRIPIPKQTKKMLVKVRGGMCEYCKEEIYQHIHHVNGDPTNNHPNNLMLVCFECHKQIESEKVYK